MRPRVGVLERVPGEQCARRGLLRTFGTVRERCATVVGTQQARASARSTLLTWCQGSTTWRQESASTRGGAGLRLPPSFRGWTRIRLASRGVQGNSGGLARVARGPKALQAAVSTDQASTASPAEEKAAWKLPLVKERKRVILVRHGESTWNATGRIQGSSNFSELTEKGVVQAETSRQMLAADTFDICFHSPLQRSAKTAAIIWGKREAPMVALDDLREIDLYSFQGLFKEEGKARYGAQFKMWQLDAANFEIDGHYPVRELWARARLCWEEILQSEAQSVLVVAHNAVNQALVATSIGLGPEYFRVLLQSNCGVSVLDFRPSLGATLTPLTPLTPSADLLDSAAASTLVSLNRLNQTPSPPVGAIQSAGRKAKCRVILVCHGMTESQAQRRFPKSGAEKLNMLGVVQSRKTSELLLDVRVDTIFSSPCASARETANCIFEVQAAADCLGADCIPRYVDVVPMDALRDFDYGSLQGKERPSGVKLREALTREGGEKLEELQARAGVAWGEIRRCLAESERELAEFEARKASTGGNDSEDDIPEGPPSCMVLAVSHVMTIKALVAQCLEMEPNEALTFAIDQGCICVVDFPDGALGKGVVRCLNYTAHLGRWAVPVTSPSFDDEAF